MRSKAIFMALLALAFQAQAVPVSQPDAVSAARAWAQRGRHMGVALGRSVEDSVQLQTESGTTFYAVKMGGGTVFTSGDTEVEPIVAFTSEDIDVKALDEKSPLWALLNRDLSRRQPQGGRRLLAAAPTVSAARAETSRAANGQKWQALLDEAARPVRRFGLLAAAFESDPSDVRVPALMRTKWSQSGGIWNYYTPPGKDHYTTENAVCGCVATAIAQVMRYYHGTPDAEGEGGLQIPFPKEAVEQQAFACQYKGSPIQLTLQGGTYAWDNMPFTSADVKTEEQKKNIGKLTSDVGISVKMMYAGPGGSGAVYRNAVNSLMGVFGYKQISWCSAAKGLDVAGESGLTFLGQTMFANFDAKRPCLVGIPGHAIVADGYGYEVDVPYVHLNFGWAGQCDFWYNLPDMTAAGAEYNLVDDIGYNIFPEVGGTDEGGQPTHAIFSGRVLDDDGASVKNCPVTVRSEGVDVTNLVTDAHGVWSAILPAGTYDVDADPGDGIWTGELDEAVALEITGPEAGAGNSWGNDIQLQHPSVRIRGEEDKSYSSLDRAFVRAREIAQADPTAPVTLEIIDPTMLKRNQTVDFNCVIVATNDDPQAVLPAVRQRDAALTVAEGFALTLTNVVFAGSSAAVLKVEDGGQLILKADVDFGVGTAVAAETTAADGFVLAGMPVKALTLRCANARNQGDVFGLVDAEAIGSEAEATAAAALIVNAFDGNREIRGVAQADGTLIWDEPSCPLEDAAGYFVVGEATNAYARLDRVIDEFQKAVDGGETVSELVVLKSDALTRSLTVAKPLKISGVGSPDITCGASSGFLVSNKLEIGGLSFGDYAGKGSLFLVDGGELTLGEGVTVHDVASDLNYGYSAALHVRRGKAIVNGATFERCANRGKKGLGGGAVSVGDTTSWGGGYELVLNGGAIVDCSSVTVGGGVYAYSKAKITIGGDLTVKGNVSGSNSLADDLYIGYDDVTFALAPEGLADGEVERVGVRYEGSLKGNDLDDAFVSAAQVASAVDVTNSAAALFNDCDPSLVARLSDDGQKNLVWAVADKDLSTKDPELAVVRVGDKLFASLSDALETLSDDGVKSATFEVVRDFAFVADVVVDFALTICSTGDVASLVTRAGDVKIRVEESGSLTLTNVVFNGGDGAGGLFDVHGSGAAMSLKQGAVIDGVNGSADRASGAVAVWDGATFTMESGAAIVNCTNAFVNAGTESGYGGALLLDNAKAHLLGGVISNCVAMSAGGVFANNKSEVDVAGDLVIAGNANLSGQADNLRLSENSRLSVSNPLVGASSIGYTEGARSIDADVNVFGFAKSSETLTETDIANSARRFAHDVTGDRGQAVHKTGSSDYQLVWSAAIVGGKYGDGDYVDAGTPVAIAKPSAVEGLVYTGEEQVGVPEGAGYSVVGNRATNAGTNYLAVAKLNSGFVWVEDDTTDPIQTSTAPVSNVWEIAKASIDVSGISFQTNFVYDGTVHRVILDESTVPAGVTVTLGKNDIGWIDAGTNTVSVTFDVADTNNYETIEGQILQVVIAKAKYDISGVVFKDVTSMYNGQVQSNCVDEASLLTLPDGVTFAGYENNGQVTSGVYEVKALFAGDEKNHEKIEPLTATLRIYRNPDMPDERLPGPGPVVVQPDPIAFKSIEKVDETTWRLVVTDAVQWCNYAIFATNSLAGGFAVTNSAGELIVDPVTNFQWKLPDKEITLELQADGSQLFWKAEAKEGKAE